MMLFYNKKFLWFLLLYFVVVINIPSVYMTDLMIGHDATFHAARIESIKEGLESFNFPVKMYGYVFNDYGSPTGYFYPDLFLYVPAFFRLLGLDAKFSYPLFLFIITLFTAVISFLSFNKLFKYIKKDNNTPYYLYGFVASVIYTGSMYHFMDLYVRAAIGEAIAVIFLPMGLIGFYLMLKDNSNKNSWIFVTIGATGVLESHILSSLLLFFAYILMSLIFFRSFFCRDTLKSLLKATVFVIFLNVWFYAPFIGMYESFDFVIKGALTSAKDISVYSWTELFKYRFFLGSLAVAVLFIYLFYILIKLKKNRIFSCLDKIFIICFLFCVIFTFIASNMAPWDIMDSIPLLGKKLGALQFSFRLAMFTTFFAAIAISIAICINKKFLIIAFIIPISTMFWMMNTPYNIDNFLISICTKENVLAGDRIISLKGKEAGNELLSSLDMIHNPILGSLYGDYLYGDFVPAEHLNYTDPESIEYMEAIRNKNLFKLDPYEITPKNAVTNFSRKGLNLDFTTNANESTEIKLPLWYYPHCYMATCDGKEIPVFEVYHHRLAINAPEGEHNIKVFPKLHTPYRNACIISVIGLLIFIYVCIRERAKDEERFL